MRCEATLFAVLATSQNEARVTYFVLIGRSHGELGRSTAYSLLLSSDKMGSVEIRSAEIKKSYMHDYTSSFLLCVCVNELFANFVY